MCLPSCSCRRRPRRPTCGVREDFMHRAPLGPVAPPLARSCRRRWRRCDRPSPRAAGGPLVLVGSVNPCPAALGRTPNVGAQSSVARRLGGSVTSAAAAATSRRAACAHSVYRRASPRGKRTVHGRRVYCATASQLESERCQCRSTMHSSAVARMQSSTQQFECCCRV